MNKAYFASLVTLPTIIDKIGNYKTRGGDVVEISRVSIKHDFGCRGRYLEPGGVAESWHKTGRIMEDRETLNDIVSAV